MSGYSVFIRTEPLSDKIVDPKTAILVVFVDSPLSEKTLASFPALKLIATMSTGYDHIDLNATKKRGIPVCNVPTYGENTVAEHALALMLALSRKLFPSIERTKKGTYDYHGLQGFDLAGKTIGIVGTGHIGMHLIRMLQGFDADIIAYDLFPKKGAEKKYGFTYTTFTRLIRTADILSLHTPLLPSTHHMIDKVESIQHGSNNQEFLIHFCIRSTNLRSFQQNYFLL